MNIPRLQNPTACHWSGGQPAADAWAPLAKAGVRAVIDLRPSTEDHGHDEAAALAAEGLAYHQIAVAGVQDLTLAKAKALDALLAQLGDTPTLIHCASSNRVGALMALRAAWIYGASHDDALALGRSYGLLAMEQAVTSLLAKGP